MNLPKRRPVYAAIDLLVELARRAGEWGAWHALKRPLKRQRPW